MQAFIWKGTWRVHFIMFLWNKINHYFLKWSNLVQLLTSPDGSTWTVIISTPQGLSCLATSGENWTPVERQGAKMGDPT